MKNFRAKLSTCIIFSFILTMLVFIGCEKKAESQDSGVVDTEIQPQVDNTADSLAIVDYIDCGNISIGGDYNYDENGKIYYQYGTSHYTSDGRFVYLSEDGVEIGALECGEEHIENDVSNSSNNQNVQTEKQWVNCKYCHGSGLKDCYSCNGKGTQHCGSCSNYKETCSVCIGSRTYGNCNECDGRGQVLIEY